MTPVQGAANLTGWIRRKIVAAVNKALRDVGKAAAQVAENAVAEAERQISNGQKAVGKVKDTAKSAVKAVTKHAPRW